MSWLSLVLISVNFSAVSGIFDKFFCSKKFKNVLSYLVLGNLLQLPFLISLLFFVKHSIPLGWPLLFALLSGPLFFAMWFLYFKALVSAEASRVGAIFNVTLIFNLILATLLLGERLTNVKILAIILIFIGATICSYEKEKLKKEKFNPAYLLVILSALIASIGNILTKAAVETVSPLSTYLLSYSAGLPIFLGLLLKKPIRNEIKEHLLSNKNVGLIFFNKTLSFFSVCLYYLALAKGPVSLIGAVSNGVYPLLMFIYTTISSLFFPHIIKERIEKEVIFLKLLAIVLIVGGVVIISL